MTEKYLIVMPYNQGGSQGREIELSLKGWRKFATFKYHFVVIGEFSQELAGRFPWVEWIYKPKLKKRMYQYNQHLDVQNCMEIIANKYGNEYNGFVWIADDNYAVKPFNIDYIKTVHYHADTFDGVKDLPANFWKHDKWKTRQLLDANGLPHVNYTTHYPCWFEFQKLNEIWDLYDMRNESYVLEDIYYNHFAHLKPVLDDVVRFGVWNKESIGELKKALTKPEIKFVCNSVDGWSVELENILEEIIK